MTDVQREIMRVIANSKNPAKTVETLYLKALALKREQDEEQRSDRSCQDWEAFA